MIYKESEASQYECRAPGAFVREKPFGELYPKFIFPRCAGPLCAHWLRHRPELYYFPNYSNWKTSEAKNAKEFQWKDQIYSPINYYKKDVSRPTSDSTWCGTDNYGYWKRQNPNVEGQCELNFSSIEISVST